MTLHEAGVSIPLRQWAPPMSLLAVCQHGGLRIPNALPKDLPAITGASRPMPWGRRTTLRRRPSGRRSRTADWEHQPRMDLPSGTRRRSGDVVRRRWKLRRRRHALLREWGGIFLPPCATLHIPPQLVVLDRPPLRIGAKPYSTNAWNDHINPLNVMSPSVMLPRLYLP